MRKAARAAIILVLYCTKILSAESGYDLFQKALVKERAEGKIEEAIQLYQRIVTEFASDRTLAAKALVQMGQSLEKLGKTEARQMYERIVRDFADQPKPLRVARSRMAALGMRPGLQSGSALSTRQLWEGTEVDLFGAVSPDGRFLSFVDWETGDLAIRDFSLKQTRRLTHKGAWSDSPEFHSFA